MAVGGGRGTDRAWERFHAGEDPDDVRSDVLTSWRRSRINGVDPEHVEVPFVETDLDTPFVRVAVPIMAGLAELLVGAHTSLALADERGSVVWRWVSEPMLRDTLDELRVVQGFCFGEEFVGTNGLGTALETGRLALVQGAEHFVQRFHDVTCVAAPVRHPLTRRTVGAVNLTCRAEHTTPLLSLVVRRLVEEVRAALLEGATARERRLLQAFLAARAEAGGPVLTVGDDVVIADSAACDLGLDHRDVWDRVRGRRDAADGAVVALSSELSARLRLVHDGGATTGAVLTLTEPATSRHSRAPAADEPGQWDLALEQARALAAEGPVVVRGEPGTGRTTLLTTVLGADAALLDAATCVVEGTAAWTRRFAACLDRAAMPLVVRHVELLPGAAAQAVAALLGTRSAGRIAGIGVTVTVGDATRGSSSPAPVLDGLGGGAVTLPPLRRRASEVVGLAQRELHRHGRRRSFSLDAQAALRRYDWPGNLAELARVVREAASRSRGDVVGLDALPAEVRAAAARRVLTPLERAESSVIATVLQECGGNKSAAAKTLGISRSALYVKLRSYRL
jgi:sigma-54 dependent transcriptional regulator, acetoin dehydrogenase operon transcriptional activator AcoR